MGEADRIVTLLTREEGLVRAAASSARDLAKGQPAALDLFVLSRFWIHRSKTAGKLPRLRGVELVKAHMAIRTDYGRVCAASYMTETLARTVQERQESTEVFDLFAWCLSELDGDANIHRVLLTFIVRLLASIGMAPELDRCVKCRSELSGEAHLSQGEGGVVCTSCHGLSSGEPVTSGDRAVIRFLLHKPLNFLEKLKISDADAVRLYHLLHIFARHHLGFEPKAVTLFKKR